MNEFIGAMKIEMFKREGDYPDLPIIYISKPFKGWVPGNVFLPVNKSLDVEIRWKEEKPPLGVRPRKLWLEQRYEELFEAICRYRDAGKEYPKAWDVEREIIKLELRG